MEYLLVVSTIDQRISTMKKKLVFHNKEQAMMELELLHRRVIQGLKHRTGVCSSLFDGSKREIFCIHS